ncbi:MAG: TIR domain-containing protein [Oculatellaceae cyanobacterium bins.114]|nr:TIR domain-containing protein [Oculatellaceae cyanobacterium bins.114]
MPPSNSIFISYRRSDSNDVTGRIYDRLSEHFGRKVVFKDVDSIPPGVDFRTHLNQGVGNCQVLVAVIGSTWLSVQDDEGNRRLDKPDDWVRAEIETALGRNIPVIPLLVGGARLPRVDELPNTLAELAYRNAAQARPDPDFHQDLTRLIRALEEIVGSPELSVEAEAPTNSAQTLKLQYLQNKRSNLEQQLEVVQAEMEAIADVTIKGQYENRLNLLFQQIEQVDQDIQKVRKG